MSTRRIQDALTIFRQACELLGDERAAFLQSACGQDPELRAELESMLAFDASQDEDGGEANAQAHPVRAALADLIGETQAPSPPERIGGYRIVRRIARGGMGEVYEAAQEHPARRVAIKLAFSGGVSPEHAKRFALEAQLLARLQHPAIAQIFATGTTPRETGARPFIVMELVEGRPLVDYATAHALPVGARLELMVRVSEPVAFAHDQGVIHRDLKPDNVLVGADGAPKVLDFGVAKVAAAGDFGAATLHTETGRVIGTMGYMAPEQLAGQSQALTPAADVYSLGVMTYQLLSGRLPHELDGVTLSRALAVVTTTDAPLLGVVRAEFRGDLEAIVAKALEKEPRDRYPDAAAFRADLLRFLRDEPVQARRHSTFQRMRKFSRRHRGLVGGLTATVLSLLLGLVVALVLAARAAEQRARFDRLEGVVQYDNLQKAAPALCPPWPEKATAIEQWLADCERLVATRPAIERTVQELHERRPAAGSAERFLQDELTGLLANLEHLHDTRIEVDRRHRWATSVVALTLHHPNARCSWPEARAAIAASERYSGPEIALNDADVLGLVPIGENPATKLWELYHLRSAWDGTSDPRTIAIPAHRPDGSIEVTAGMGIVFVLIPGGTFRMGSQSADAREFELPVHDVTLAPYLLSRYELTQGQWARLTGGERPSYFSTGNRPRDGSPRPFGDDRHPVEQVDWHDCQGLLARYGLTLPTEAQWEYGCRAGTSSTWFTGDTPDSLSGFANLLDATARRERPVLKGGVAFDDGFLGTAPVGSLGANAFGLFDVHGNVIEWVRDAVCSYDNTPRPGDGLREGSTRMPHPDGRMARGGSLNTNARAAGSASRHDGPPTVKLFDLGVRPARPLCLAE